MELITGENDKGRRLDRILRKALPDYPLPLIHRLLRQGKVFTDGKPAKAQDRQDSGVKITIHDFTNTFTNGQKNTQVKKRDLKLSQNESLLEILYSDRGLLAVNKPAGIEVHGDNSLETIVRSYLDKNLPPSLSFKPGPLHRLDKPSSGIVVFSSSLEGAQLFSSLLQKQKVKKTYLAVVEGKIEKEEIWQDKLVRDHDLKKTFISENSQSSSQEKTAITKITPLKYIGNKNGGLTLIKAEIATGRTHQIRAQAAFHGFPLAGDKKYGGSNKQKKRFLLHAWKLEFAGIYIEAPLPQELKSLYSS
ncbi:MAG: RluA family pseudouridine synthase [Treponema sp.]|nr:RluA family pseudouridine synthase [Treponema sp.]